MKVKYEGRFSKAKAQEFPQYEWDWEENQIHEVPDKIGERLISAYDGFERVDGVKIAESKPKKRRTKEKKVEEEK